MCCFVILLLSNEMQMSVRRFSAIPHLRAREGEHKPLRVLRLSGTFHEKNSKQHQNIRPDVTALNFLRPRK